MKIIKVDYMPVRDIEEEIDDYVYFDFSFKSLLYKLIVRLGFRISYFEKWIISVKDFFDWW